MTVGDDAGHVRALWRAFLEAAPAGVAVFDREMRYLEASGRWRQDYGLGSQDVIGRSHYDIFPEIPGRWKEIHRRCLAGASERCDADPFPRADGSVDWVRWEIRPWRHRNGKIGGIIIFSELITERKNAEEALKLTEARYRALIEQAPEAILVYDIDVQRFVDCNRNAELLFACGREELLSGGPNRFYLSDQPDGLDAGDSFRAHNEEVGDGRPVSFQRRIRNARGEELVCEVRLVPLPSARNRLVRASMIDITERVRAEQALREQEARYRGLVEQDISGVVVVRSDGRVAYVNPRFARMAGCAPEDLAGHPLLEIVPEEDHQTVLEALGRQLAGKTPTVRITSRLRMRTGEIRDILVNASRSIYEGQPASMAVVLDITEEKRKEAAERETADRLRAIIDSSNDAIFSRDRDGVVTTWNAAAERIFGYTAAEVIGRHNSMFAVPGYEADLAAVTARVRRGERIENHETRRRCKDGRILDVVLSMAPIHDARGNIIGASTTARDVTAAKAAQAAVRLQEELYRATYQQAPVGIAFVDSDLRYVHVNETLASYLGVSMESLIGRSVGEVVPDIWETIRPAMRSALRSGAPIYNLEVVGNTRTASGAPRQELVSYQPVIIDGKTMGLSITVVDITDRREAEAERNRLHDHLTRVQRVTKVGSVEVDLQTGRVIWSDELYDWCGLVPQSRPPAPELLMERVHPDDRATLLDYFRRGRQGETVEPHEYRFRDASGRWRWHYRQTEVIRDAAGRPVTALAMMYDITERKLAEAARLASDERYRATFDQAPIGIAHVDVDGRYTMVNDTLCRLFGYPREDLLGRDFRELTLPEDVAEADEWTRRLIDGEVDVVSRERRFVRKDGAIVWCQVQTKLAAADSGQGHAYITTVTDISERKAAERQRAELERQLRQAQKMEAIGLLTGGVAHDFNNILSIVLGNLELVQEDVEGNELAAGQIADAVAAVRRGADLTHRLLAFSRRQPLEPVPVDVNQKIGALIPMLSRILGEQIELRERLAEAPWKVVVDAGQLDSAILNLSVNSRDAMAGGGTLTISTENVNVDAAYAAQRPELATGRYVRISVSDSGCGMSPDVVAKAFDPFFTTKEVGKGTGLGLSMVYGFAKQSGGNAAIYSEQGVGTTVTLLLPAEPEDAARAGAAAKLPEAVGGNETVLVVEDDPQVRKVTVAFLKSLGYTTCTAGTVMEGLDVLRTNPHIDLVMTDVILPGGLDGGDLSRQAETMRPGMKILFLSGYTEDVIMHNGRLDSGVVLLHKPFTRHDLATKVRAVIEGRAGRPRPS